MKREMSYILSVVLITASILAVGWILWRMEPPPSELQPESSNPSEFEWRRGATDPVILIKVFVDWGCPGCVKKESIASQIVRYHYPQYVAMIYHAHPHVEYTLADSKPIISEALEAAGEQGKFWEFHDAILLQTPRDVPGLKRVAGYLGLDMQLFDKALDSGKYREKVVQAGEEAALQGATHADLFINGKAFTGYPTLEAVLAVVDAELAKIGKGEN